MGREESPFCVRDSSAFGLRMTGGASLAFHHLDFLIRQLEFVHEFVYLLIRRVDLTLIQRAVMFRRGGGEALVHAAREHLLHERYLRS